MAVLPGVGETGGAELTDYDTYVFGKATDVGKWSEASVPLTNILNLAEWTPEETVTWVGDGIQGGNPFKLASPSSQATIDAVYGSEVNQAVFEGGYSIEPGGGGYPLLVP
jgi:hypothetical protein